MSSILAYSTSTSGEVVDNRVEAADPVYNGAAYTYDEMIAEPHCFVCGRHTDHWGEHDDMVEAGTARYEKDGSVYPVPWAWDR